MSPEAVGRSGTMSGANRPEAEGGSAGEAPSRPKAIVITISRRFLGKSLANYIESEALHLKLILHKRPRIFQENY